VCVDGIDEGWAKASSAVEGGERERERKKEKKLNYINGFVSHTSRAAI